MQKWYDEGYFAADLLMKRTNIDQDWTPVGELAHRANGAQVFLSHFSSNSAPPGLARQVDSSFDGFVQSRDASGLNLPYQPIPTRSLHPSGQPLLLHFPPELISYTQFTYFISNFLHSLLAPNFIRFL